MAFFPFHGDIGGKLWSEAQKLRLGDVKPSICWNKMLVAYPYPQQKVIHTSVMTVSRPQHISARYFGRQPVALTQSWYATLEKPDQWATKTWKRRFNSSLTTLKKWWSLVCMTLCVTLWQLEICSHYPPYTQDIINQTYSHDIAEVSWTMMTTWHHMTTPRRCLSARWCLAARRILTTWLTQKLTSPLPLLLHPSLDPKRVVIFGIARGWEGQLSMIDCWTLTWTPWWFAVMMMLTWLIMGLASLTFLFLRTPSTCLAWAE